MDTELITHRLGVGFNPQYLSGKLTWPPDAEYIEAGIGLLEQDSSESAPWHPHAEVSLHLSRAPFCQPLEEQYRFLSRLKQNLPKSAKSIGFHLCGSLTEGLGIFGFGSTFIPDTSNKIRAREFVSLLQDEINLPILLENANYYEQNSHQALQVFDFINELANRSNISLILDLSHLLMCAHNTGMSEMYLLGRTNPDLVSVLHLSGIHISKDGAMHDGHQYKVHHRVWELAHEFLSNCATPKTLVLEHTDPCWSDSNLDFYADLDRIRKLCGTQSKKATHIINQETVSLGYLSQVIIPHRFPMLSSQLGADRLRVLVRQWGNDYLNRRSCQTHPKLAVKLSDKNLFDQDSFDPLEDFSSYIMKYCV